MVQETTGRPVAVETRPPRDGDVRDSLAGLERAGAVLGYHPVVSLREGLAKTWKWFQES